jgi:protein gp37
MGDSQIEWTDKVWNATRGCSRISPGCGGAKGEGGCYAERQAYRFSGPGQPYEGLVRLGKQGPRWTGVVRLIPEKLAEPLRWRKPQRIFVNSMSDLFHEALTNEQIAAVFGVMAACPQHTFQVLTKRAARMREWFEWVDRVRVEAGCSHAFLCADSARDAGAQHRSFSIRAAGAARWPLPNVHLGVSCEDQQRADERIRALLKCPAAVRWVSAEPLLGPLDLRRYVDESPCMRDHAYEADGAWKKCTIPDHKAPRIGWLVAGGESGPGTRPMDIAWMRSLRDQCKANDVPYFAKQLGARANAGGVDAAFPHASGWPVGTRFERPTGSHGWRPLLRDSHGGDWDEWPSDLRVREYPTPC